MSTEREQRIASYIDSIDIPETELEYIDWDNGWQADASNDIIVNFEDYVEAVSERVHDLGWGRAKVKQGYVYGEVRNDDPEKGQLTHPMLVPYDMLTEAQKDLDRYTVRTVLRELAFLFQDKI